MPRVTQIEVLRKAEQPVIFIRTKTNVGQLPRLIGECYMKMAAYLKEIGELLSDIPYVAYHNMDMQNLDVEIGFPVPAPLPGKDEIQPGAIPAGKVVFCLYRGAYNELEKVYAEMSQWIADNHYQPVGTAYECYYNGPEFPESERLTKIVMPLK